MSLIQVQGQGGHGVGMSFHCFCWVTGCEKISALWYNLQVSFQSLTPNHFATTNQRSTSPCFKSLHDKKMHRLKRSPKQSSLRPSANPQVSTSDSRREASPGLTANFSSNNPFRNRAASPLPSPVTTTFDNIPSTAPERPISRNPFLDQIQPEGKDTTTLQLRQISPERELYTMAGRSPPKKPALTGNAVELFVSYPLPSK